MSSLENPLHLLLVAHTAEKGFAKVLYDRLTTEEKLRVFYDEESIEWGEVKYVKLTEALRGKIVHGALLVVSESLLERPTPKLQHLIDAVLDRMPIFPLLRGVSEATFQERMPLLRTARSVDGDGDLETIASEISRRLRCRQQRREDDLRPTALPPPTFGFEGRATELNDLSRKVLDGTPIVAVTGLPGLGKSQVVLALGRRFFHLDWTVVHVYATPYSTENEIVAAILSAMNERSGQGLSKLQEIVGRLSTSSTRLIILNRCDNLIKNCPDLLISLLRILTPVFRIVTTSTRGLDCSCPTVDPFPMEPLNADVAADIILTRLNSGRMMIVTPEKARRLATLSGGMPMAIQLLISGHRRGFSDDDLSDSDRQVRFLDYLDKVSTFSVEPDRSVSKLLEAIYDYLPKPLQDDFIALNLFQLPFTKDDVAVLLDSSKSMVMCDVIVPLLDCSLLSQASSSDVYYLHTLVCQYLRNKCKSGLPPRTARLRYVTLMCSKLREVAKIYEINPVEAIGLYDSNQQNYNQIFKFADDFDAGDVSKDNYCLALDAASLLKAVVSSDDRRRIFKLCSRAAEKSGDWHSHIRLEMKALEAVLDNPACVLSPEDKKCLTNAIEKAGELGDQLLLAECFLMKAQQLMAENDFKWAFSILMRDATGKCYLLQIPEDTPLVSSCNFALGVAAEKQHGNEFAIDFYNLASKRFQGGDCPPKPDMCALQLHIARCLFNSGKFKESLDTYLKVLQQQEALSCNLLSLEVVRYHMAIARLSNACGIACFDLEEIKSAVNNLKEIDKKMDGRLHPLKGWSSLAIGKGLLTIEINRKRQKQAKARDSYEEAKTYFVEALDVSKSVSLHEVDYTELAVECHAYLTIY